MTWVAYASPCPSVSRALIRWGRCVRSKVYNKRSSVSSNELNEQTIGLKCRELAYGWTCHAHFDLSNGSVTTSGRVACWRRCSAPEWARNGWCSETQSTRLIASSVERVWRVCMRTRWVNILSTRSQVHRYKLLGFDFELDLCSSACIKRRPLESRIFPMLMLWTMVLCSETCQEN